MKACSRLGVVLLAFTALATTPMASAACSRANTTVAAKSWHATGTIRSFGPGRAYVNIAHDDIPGYMAAMTMSFEPKHPSQLDGLSVNDRVELDFVDQDDGRRILTNIKKK